MKFYVGEHKETGETCYLMKFVNEEDIRDSMDILRDLVNEIFCEEDDEDSKLEFLNLLDKIEARSEPLDEDEITEDTVFFTVSCLDRVEMSAFAGKLFYLVLGMKAKALFYEEKYKKMLCKRSDERSVKDFYQDALLNE